MGLVISALVTFWVGFLIYKKYKPQPVLFLGGMILMYIAAIFGYGTILPAKAATGSTFFDAFEFIRATMSSNAGKLGMNIMAVGAFARYMDKIGASRSLVRLTGLTTRYRSFWLLSLLSAHCTISLKNIWINVTDMSSSRWKLKNLLKMIRLTARRSGMRSCRLFRWL